jgi:DNA primase
MIEDLLEHIGVEDIRSLGEEVQARCPMHEKRTGERERRPDHWSINRYSGAHHCFSCEYSGSLTRLIMDVAKVNLWDAHGLIRRFDVDLSDDEAPWEPPIGMMIETRLEDFGPPPPRALARRHLTPEVCDRYQLRWDYEEAAWIIPIFSPSGEKWGWQTKGSEIRNHPPGIKKGKTLFGLTVLRGERALLVESPLDVAYLDTLGVPAVAAFGCQVSDMQLKLLVERLDALVLALDDDKAGISETFRIIREKWHHRIPISVFNYRSLSGKDPGELSPAEVRKGLDGAVLAAFW